MAIQRKADHVQMGRNCLKRVENKYRVQFQLPIHVHCIRKEHILNIQTIDTL